MNIDRRRLFSIGAAGLAAPAILRLTAGTARAATTAAVATPVFSRRRVGRFVVTALLDGTLDASPDIVIGYDAEAAARALERQHLQADAPTMPLPVLGYVVDTGERLVAIDSGTMPGFAPRLAGYHEALRQAGISAADIDDVLVTHLHPDHIGGLSNGGERLFPSAQVHVSETEWNFWHDDALTGALPEAVTPFVGMAREFVAPYDGRIVTFGAESEILPGIQAVPLPGHTPGHAGFRFHSEGEDLLIWGDVMHLTRLQFDNPDWLVVFDMDQDLARTTRRRVYDMAAADNLMVAGSHIDFPGAGYVERSADGYRFAPAVHDYML